jgi:hypothetical protein
LFISIRSAASCCHPLQLSAEPRGARTTKASACNILKLSRTTVKAWGFSPMKSIYSESGL